MKIWITKKYGIIVNIDSYINMNKFGHIYMIINKINNKRYIGQSINVKRRICEHIQKFKENKNNILYYAFNKYGLNNFEFKIIDIANNMDDLNTKEIQYISLYKSNNKEFGYNLESGGWNSSPCIETLEKMSKSHQGTIQDNEWVKKRVAKAGTNEAKKYGKPKTEKDKINLSLNSPKFWQGKNRDEETKKKISETKKILGFSDKQKEIICKKVYKINTYTNKVIQIFDSTAHASKIENVNQSTISRWCSKNKIIKGILWRY